MNQVDGVEDLILQAKQCAQKKDYARAILLCEKALEQDDTSVELHKLSGMIHFLEKNYPKAIEHFTRITRLDPRDGKNLVNLGAVYNRSGDYKNATSVLRKALQKERSSSEAYYNLGIAYKGQGQSSMAISAYREALRLNPQMADAHLNLGNVYSDMGNQKQAIIQYQKALEVRPGFQRAQSALMRAQAASDEAKKNSNPFGRLVDTDKYRTTHSNQSLRKLSEAEQVEDRLRVYRLSKEIRTEANALVAQLKESLIPILLTMNRDVSEVNFNPWNLEEHFHKYQEAIESYNTQKKALHRKVLELRAHEEVMNTPDMPS